MKTLEERMAETMPVVTGTLDILVLKALSWVPMHGFEIIRWLEARSAGSLDLEDSALYQALYRMEARGLVTAEWGVTENNRKARYYKISRSGRAQLKMQTSQWLQYASIVSGILATANSGG